MKPAQERFIQALKETVGIVTDAAELCGIERQNHYNWLKENEEYAQAVRDISEIEYDFIESALKNKIRNGDTAAIIFASKTKLRSRGYGEVVEHRGQGTAGEIVFRLDYGNTDADPSGH